MRTYGKNELPWLKPRHPQSATWRTESSFNPLRPRLKPRSSRIEESPSAIRRRAGRKTNGFYKLLILAAVILFVWVLGKAFIHSSGNEGDYYLISGSEEVITEATSEDLEQSSQGLLGGPFSSLEQILFSSAQGAVDFSADDAAEDSDLVILQENSLVATNCPAPEAVFSIFRKEILTHIVQAGENPEKIALKYGINTYTLLWANNLKDGDIIRPGDKLIVLPINGVRVKIVSGDTLNSLAKKYQGKEDEIIAFNNLLADGTLKIGEYIIIPGGEMPTPVKPKPTVSSPRYASSVQRADWLIIPTTGRNWGRIHAYNGVDISNPCGTPIYAAASGKVILADSSGWNGGYGKYIKIQHPNGVITLYAHLSGMVVVGGESVAQGQLIGYMGITGRSTGCHLHFEVRGAKNPLAR